MDTECTWHREVEEKVRKQVVACLFLLILILGGSMGMPLWLTHNYLSAAILLLDTTPLVSPPADLPRFATLRESDVAEIYPVVSSTTAPPTTHTSTLRTPSMPAAQRVDLEPLPATAPVAVSEAVVEAAQLKPPMFTTTLTQELHLPPATDVPPFSSLAIESVESSTTRLKATYIPQNPVPSLIIGTVKSGQTALGILTQAGISIRQGLSMQRAVQHVYNLQRLHIGHRYTVALAPAGHLKRFTYEIGMDRRLVVQPHGDTFVGDIEPIPVHYSERTITGRIDDSIYVTLTSQGESPQLVQDFVDVFSWKLNMATDIRQGDTFRLLVEERARAGHPPQYHRILAAELVNEGTVWQAVYYEHKKRGEYYRPDGASLRGMFLRTPLRYTRISSYFSRRRLHPILKRYRPHWGIDYAAPSGTPVHSVGDGVVKWIGRKGQNGNMVKIKHDNIYTSYYLHLSRYAKGIESGVHVKQGQIIGYVGATGLATGPHLDFRLSKGGHYINPLTHESIEAPSIPSTVLPTFHKYVKQQLTKLYESPPQRVASTDNGQDASH